MYMPLADSLLPVTMPAYVTNCRLCRGCSSATSDETGSDNSQTVEFLLALYSLYDRIFRSNFAATLTFCKFLNETLMIKNNSK